MGGSRGALTGMFTPRALCVSRLRAPSAAPPSTASSSHTAAEDDMLVANPDVIRWGLIGAGSVCEVRCIEVERRTDICIVPILSEHFLSSSSRVCTDKECSRLL